MGRPSEIMEQSRPSSQNKATFNGATALIGILSLILTIVSVAVPHWGSYSPQGSQYFASGYRIQDNTGHFGPFQVCHYEAYYSICGSRKSQFQPSNWLFIAGICAIVTILALGAFCLFAILHVAMQLQRREISISFKKCGFLKLMSSAIAVCSNVAAVILGGIEFGVASRGNGLAYKISVCYYLQIFLIFVNILLVILSYIYHKKNLRNPGNLVPKGRASNYVTDPYDNRYVEGGGNGVSMTHSSGVPYSHGTPRLPIHPQPNSHIRNPHQYTANAISSYANGHTLPTVHFTTATQPGPQTAANGGQVNNGFTAVGLHAPNGTSSPTNSSAPPQPLPIQAIRPIQAVQPQVATTCVGNPVGLNLSHLPQVLPTGGGGVSFTPHGRNNAGYTKMGHMGSSESLDSTQSLTLSSYSLGSSTSTGSSHGPLRSSLKKPKNRDVASVSSKSSSKQVRISLGAEQTAI